MPNEKPIIFSAPMVRAILEDRKDQTRRIVSPQPASEETLWPNDDSHLEWGDIVEKTDYYVRCGHCPYGKPGDRLWVRENWQLLDVFEDTYHGAKEADVWRGPIPKAKPEKEYCLDYAADGQDGPWRPCIHMPRWASRILLEITEVRVQRVQEISEEDAKAEGIQPFITVGSEREKEMYPEGYKANYKLLWDSINAKREGGNYAWKHNPWVWAITYRRT